MTDTTRAPTLTDIASGGPRETQRLKDDSFEIWQIGGVQVLKGRLTILEFRHAGEDVVSKLTLDRGVVRHVL
jgi:hypothetical protein